MVGIAVEADILPAGNHTPACELFWAESPKAKDQMFVGDHAKCHLLDPGRSGKKKVFLRMVAKEEGNGAATGSGVWRGGGGGGHGGGRGGGGGRRRGPPGANDPSVSRRFGYDSSTIAADTLV